VQAKIGIKKIDQKIYRAGFLGFSFVVCAENAHSAQRAAFLMFFALVL